MYHPMFSAYTTKSFFLAISASLRLYTTLKFWCSIFHSCSLPFFGYMPGCRSRWDQSKTSKQLAPKFFSSIVKCDCMVLFTV